MCPSQRPEDDPIIIRENTKLDIRSGRLSRREREDPGGDLQAREPDELFDVLDELEESVGGDEGASVDIPS